MASTNNPSGPAGFARAQGVAKVVKWVCGNKQCNAHFTTTSTDIATCPHCGTSAAYLLGTATNK